jgi:cytochrome c5
MSAGMRALMLLALLAPLPGMSQSGKAIWEGTCQMCHAEPLSGAPLITSKEAWAPRLKKGRQALYRSALQGFTGPKGTEMPARGGNPSLTDEQVKAAVDYMTETVSK